MGARKTGLSLNMVLPIVTILFFLKGSN